ITKGIHNSIGIDNLTENLLWCWSTGLVHAIHTFSCIWWSESSAYIEHAYDSEICDKQVAILPDEDTIRCKIAMQNSLLMGTLECRSNLIQVTTGSTISTGP